MTNYKLSKEDKLFFSENGFLIINNFFSTKKVNNLKKRSEKIFNGYYETRISPDKIKWKKGYSKTIPRQLCNVWKSDLVLRSAILHKRIGKIASQLMNWSGVRLCQDSLIWVPPATGGVSMHQDNSYQEWHSPGKIITCWIALTDASSKNSGLEYLSGSHKDKNISRPVKNFFGGSNYLYTINKKKFNKFKKYTIEAKAGSIAFHHGNTWHGSSPNKSNKERVSISCHYIHKNSKFTKINHIDYSRYKKKNTLEMDESFFPIL
jgi:ectoine hydroxylase-related dioxygenase (phytanoyl-CoA dioxygenase family)